MSAEAGLGAFLIKFGGYILATLAAAVGYGSLRKAVNNTEQDLINLKEEVTANRNATDKKISETLIRVHDKLDETRKDMNDMHIALLKQIKG